MLNKREYELLIKIINNNKCFDRRDNTFNIPNTDIAKVVGCSPSTVDRLIRELRKQDLVRKVNTGYIDKNYQLMLSPKFIFISYTKSDRWIIGALYELMCIREVYTWSSLCRELNCFIDCETGEVKDFNWYEIDTKANYYTSFDRCYRKKSKVLYSNDFEGNTTNYKLEELDGNKLHEYDHVWFDLVNKESSFTYPSLVKDSFYTRTPFNINTIKLEYNQGITECIQEMISSGLITARR